MGVLHRVIIFSLVFIWVILPAGSANENFDFAHSKTITINGSTAGTQSDYPLKIVIFNTTGSATSGGIFLGPDIVSPAWNDIRFSNATDSAFFPYWIESTNSTSATVWINIPSIPSEGLDVAIHFGSPGAPDEQNGDTTFSLFDHFYGTSLNTTRWTATPGIYVSDSVATITTSSNRISEIRSNVQFDTGYRIVTMIKPHNFGDSETLENFYASYNNESAQVTAFYSDVYPQYAGRYYNDRGRDAVGSGSIGNEIAGIIPNTWNRHEAIKNQNDITWIVNSQNAYTFPSDYYSGLGSVRFTTYHAGTENIDWVFVGKYINPEPSIDSATTGYSPDNGWGVSLKKTVSPRSIKSGMESKVTITLLNAGQSPIHDIEILDKIPQEFRVTSGKNQYAIPGNIEPNETRILEYTIRTDKTGRHIVDSAMVVYADNEGNFHKIASNKAEIDVMEPLIKPSTDPLQDWIFLIRSWF